MVNFISNYNFLSCSKSIKNIEIKTNYWILNFLIISYRNIEQSKSTHHNIQDLALVLAVYFILLLKLNCDSRLLFKICLNNIYRIDTIIVTLKYG